MNNFLFIKNLSIKNNKSIGPLSNYYKSKSKLKKILLGLNTNIDLSNRTILLKPNWVMHSRNKDDEICLTTHPNFILATLEIILESNPRKVIVGDAPLQGCDWNRLISKSFYENISFYSNKYNIPIELKDFRRVIFNRKKNKVIKDRRDLSDYIIFDLKDKSFLEEISSKKSIFRVTDYDPDRLAISHQKGIHKYCITKDLFKVDTIITLPKVKTHQKAGITNALKILVGLNGDKDFLPHHRVGGTGFGGDCYPGKNIFRRLSEYFLDMANHNIGDLKYKYWNFISKLLWKISNPNRYHQRAAGWYGNDTTWRMVLDLNLIAKYGNSDGTISNKKQREIYSICDGIIGGQGNGPIKPEPLPLGLISFSNNNALNDIAMTKLMGFDTNKIPLVKNSTSIFPLKDIVIKLNGKDIRLDGLDKYSTSAKPPPGWKNHI